MVLSQWSNTPLELICSYFFFVKMHTRCLFTNKWFRRSCFSICIGFEDLCSEGFPACRDPTFIVLMYFQWKHYTRVPLNPFHSSTRSTRLWKRTNNGLDLNLLHKTLKMDPEQSSSLLPIFFIKCNYANCIFNLCPFLATMWQYVEYVKDVDLENWPFSNDGLDGK